MSERGLFYAFVYVDGVTHIVTFVSQNSCDRWWRALQDQRHNEGGAAPGWDIRRISPQSYVIGAQAFAFYQAHMRSFEKGFITGMDVNTGYGYSLTRYNPNPLRVLLPPSRVDHLNRKAYYIRSHARQNYFWYIDSQLISLSKRSGPTKFIIQRANPLPYDPGLQEDILVGSDEVTMTAILAAGIRGPIVLSGTNIQIDADMPIFKFKLGLLTNEGGFSVEGFGSNEIRFSDDGLGDEWELVT